MAFDLNPLALANASILRLIADATSHEISSIRGLASAVGRDQSNVGKSLRALEAAGLTHPDALMNGLTEAGAAQLAALDRAGDPAATTGGPIVLHGDLEPHPLNPRKDFETVEAEEALDELRTSIVKKGILQPILIRPRADQPGKWWIIAGERRWRAVGQAIFDGDWEEDRPILVTVRDVTDAEHLVLALTENLQRSNMSAIEEAVAFNAAVHDYGQTTEALADSTGKSQRFIQQRIALLKLTEADQDRMRLPKDHPDHLSFKAARAMTQTPRAQEQSDEVPYTPDLTTPARSPGQVQDFYHAVIGRLWLDYGVRLPDHLKLGVEQDGMRGVHVDDCVQRIADEKGLKPLPSRNEPGSPDTPAPASPTPEAPTFGKGLTDRAALIFVEIADKAERAPAEDPTLASESYTPCQMIPVEGTLADLVARGAIGFRQRGADTFVRPRLFTNDARAWLESIGFYAHRADVLFEMRARVAGTDEAAAVAEAGTYVSIFLNPADITPVPAPTLKQTIVALDSQEPEQPALIPPSPEEAEQIAAKQHVAERKEWARSIVRMVSRETLALIDDPSFEVPDFNYQPKVHHSGHGQQHNIKQLLAALRSQDPRLAMIFLGKVFAYCTHTGRLDGFRTLHPAERDQLEGRILPEALAPGGAEGPAVAALIGLREAVEAYAQDHFARAGTLPDGDAWKALSAAKRAAYLITSPDAYPDPEGAA